MRATLVYNAHSGSAPSQADILAELAKLGWDVPRAGPEELLEDGLCEDADVVVVAGGDGTVARVAKRLAGTDRPIAIVPTGTANNIARSLGLGVDPLFAIAGLSLPAERYVDLGVVRSGLATELFLEGFGFGVFADMVAEKATEQDKELRRAQGLIADQLDAYEPRHLELEIDGRDLSGTYVLAAVMNVQSLGPALAIAPSAKCDDGKLDVVLVRPEAQRGLVAHLRRAAERGDIVLPAFEALGATRLRVRADGQWAHVDETAWQLNGDTFVEVAARTLKFLLPSPSTRKE